MSFNPAYPDGDDRTALFSSAELHGSALLGEPELLGANPVTDHFYAYWAARRQDGKLPRRADIAPQDLKQYLPHAVLLDVVSAGEKAGFALTTRLIGTHVAQYFGEITGRDIAEMDNKAAAGRIYRSVATAIERRQAVLTVVKGFAPRREHLEAFALYMPLENERGAIDKILVAVDVRLSR